MAFINGGNKCSIHGCELTGFMTLFCPRCEEEKQGGGSPAKKSEGLFYLFTEVFSAPKEELVLLKSHELYYSLENLKKDIDHSRAYSISQGFRPLPSRSIWAVKKNQFKESQLVATPNIYAIHRTATTLVGVAAKLIESY